MARNGDVGIGRHNPSDRALDLISVALHCHSTPSVANWGSEFESLRMSGVVLCQDDVEGVVTETSTHMPTRLTHEIIGAAIDGFQAQKKRIDQQIAELRAMLTGGPAETVTTPEAPQQKRRKMSVAARRAVAEAQRKRWAKIRGESEPSAPATTEVPKAPKAKRRISAEGMKRIIAATKKRWRLAKAAKAASTATRKTAPVAKKVAVKRAVPKPAKKAARESVPVKGAVKKTAPSSAQATTGTVAES